MMAATRPVRSSTDPALIPLGSHQGKPPFLLTRPVFVIGSRSNARIHLVSSTVSQAHALLVRSNGGIYVRDLASRTKVIVNGKTQRETDLHNGDELQIGRFSFRFRGPDIPRDLRPAADARLRISGQALPVPIDQRVILIGRRIVCDLHLLEESVSTVHAVIFEVDGRRLIRDLGSRTGTYVNGVSTHQHQLAPGDQIRIGETNFTYELGAATGAADEPAAASGTAELNSVATLEAAQPTAIDPLDFLNEPLPPLEPEILNLPADATQSELIPLEPEPAAANKPQSLAQEPVSEPMRVKPEVIGFPVDLVEPEPSSVESAEPQAKDSPLAAEAAEPSDEAIPIADDAIAELLESFPAKEKPIAAAAEGAELPPIASAPESSTQPATPVVEVEPIVAVAEIPPAELSELSVSKSLEPAPAMDEAPVAEEVGEPPLPPREEAIAAVVADQTASKKSGRKKKGSLVAESPETSASPKPLTGKAAAIEARKFIEPPAPLPQPTAEPEAPPEPARGKVGKGKKPVSSKKQRGKPTPPPATFESPLATEIPLPAETSEMPIVPLAEAPIEPPAQPDSVEPIIVSDPALIEPADITPLGVVEPEIVEPQIVAPRERTDFELSEPSAVGPLVESLTTEADPVIASAEPVLAEEIQSLAQHPLPDIDDAILVDDQAAAPVVVGDVSLQSAEPLHLAESTPASDVAAAKPLDHDEIDALNESVPAASIVADELAAQAATAIDFGPPTTPDIAATTLSATLSNADMMELEALLGEEEQRPAADIDPVIVPDDSAAATQVEAPDTQVHEELAVSTDDLPESAPASLAQQIPDTLDSATLIGIDTGALARSQASGLIDRSADVPDAASAEPDQTPEADIAQTQASALAERVKWTANHDNVLGGQPLILPEATPSALSETPVGNDSRQSEVALPDDVGQLPAAELSGHGLSDLLGVTRPSAQPRSLTSFEGLADSPLREMDVFSHMSPPAETELIDAEVINAENGAVPADAIRPNGSISGVFGEPAQPPAHRQRVRPELNGTITAMVQPVRGQVSEAESHRVRRKYVRRVSTLVGLMVLLIGGAAITIYNFVGVSGSVEAKLKFANLGSLKQFDKNQFAMDQLTLLKQDPTRRLARRTLNERNPEIPPGFLDDQIEYVKSLDASGFSANDADTLLIRLTSKDTPADAARAYAMALALFEQDGTLSDDARKQRQGLDDLNRSIAESQNQLQAITDQINKLRLSGESAPSLQRRQQLDAQLSKTEGDWNNAVAAVKSTEAQVLQMKAAAPGSPPNAPTIAPAVANDPQLLALQQQLTDSTAKLKATHDAAAKAAADARQNLDQTLSGFQKQVADAQGLAGNNPEFTAYIQSAQRLLEMTKQLTDELIHTQEKMVGQLTELKQQLGDRMEARRVEMWQSDKELADLNERLAIANRKLNTALGTGLQKESDDLKSEIDLLKSMIKARQDLLPGDAFYSDAIQRLQNIVDAEKKNITDNRAKTEDQLTQLQQAFTSSQVVEQLPEEQKQLAAALSQRLSDINSARKQYNQTVDAGAGDADEQIQSQAATIQGAIESRQKQLADANLEAIKARQEQDRVAAIEAKETELTQLRATEIADQKLYFDTQKQVREALANADAAKDTSDKLDGLIRQKGVLQADLDSKSNQVSMRQNQVAAAIEPQKPSESDLVLRRGEDRRLFYTLCTSGTLLLLFCGLILWTLHTAHLFAPHNGFQSTDLQPHHESGETPKALDHPIAAEPASV